MPHVLRTDRLRVTVAPEIGASLASFHATIGDETLPVLRDAPRDALTGHTASPLSSFTLAPFGNRLENARFTFEGETFQLRATSSDGTTQHGDVRNRPHTVVEASETRLLCQFDSRSVPDFNFPFPIFLRTTFEVDDNALVQTLELTNVGDRAMPAGLGLHPYFVGGADLRFDAQGFYDELIPTKGMAPVPPELDFSSSRPVLDGVNHVFASFGGTATLSYPAHTVEIAADPVFTHLVVFAAPDGSTAVEPMTHASNAFNLHERGVEGVGFQRLDVGQTLRGSVRISVGR
ncbi:aldose 1-epimerase [Deinococcus yavapaiensis]|uniref:Aldose 1-epimerase n=1 Tax=Deinococcus yavapaiensis KR-236 TaxID=694435 RepID=A0A318S8Q5_9DEIO|nr:aldose 1-epimerase [Deinococcus yavapaiensis]PYE53413.1 aldose 1-epimerase [Deinococcus yavapaiensis KR-236]